MLSRGGRRAQSGFNRCRAPIDAVADQRQPPRALPSLRQLDAKGAHQARQVEVHSRHIHQRLGERAPDPVGRGRPFRRQHLAQHTQGLVQPLDHPKPGFTPKPPRQSRPRQAVEVADLAQTEPFEQDHRLGPEPQALHRQTGDRLAGLACRSDHVFGRSEARQRPGRRGRIGDGQPRGNVGRRQPRADVRQQRRLAAEQMGAAGHVDQQALVARLACVDADRG